MSQPARYLHLLEPLAQPVTAQEFDSDRDPEQGTSSPMHHFAARAGLAGVLAALIVCSSAWMAATVRMIAWIYNG